MKPEQKKVFQLFSLVLVLVVLLFFLFAFVNSGSLADEELLELDHVVLKVLLHPNEVFGDSLSVKNLVARPISADVSLERLEELVTVTPPALSFYPQETKTLALDFLAEEEGVYAGNLLFRSDGYEKRLPVVVEVESSNIAFDIQVTLSAYNTELQPGEDALFSITIYDLNGGDQSQSVDISYMLTDFSGKVLYSEMENYAFTGQTSLVKVIALPEDLEKGSYLLAVEGKMEGNVATSSYLLKVSKHGVLGSVSKVCSVSSYFCALSMLIVFLLVFFVGATLYLTFGAQIRQAKHRVTSDTTFALLILFIFLFFIVLLFFLVFNLSVIDVISSLALVPVFVYWLLLGLAVLCGLVYFFLKHPPHISLKKKKPLLAVEEFDFNVLKHLWVRRQNEKEHVKKELDRLLQQVETGEKRSLPFSGFFSRLKDLFSRRKEEALPLVKEKEVPEPLPSAPQLKKLPAVKNKPFFAPLLAWNKNLWKKSVEKEAALVKDKQALQKTAIATMSQAWKKNRVRLSHAWRTVAQVPQTIGTDISRRAIASKTSLTHFLHALKPKPLPIKKIFVAPKHKKKIVWKKIFANLLPKWKKPSVKEIPRFTQLPSVPQHPVKKKLKSFHQLFAKLTLPKIKVPHFKIKEKFVSLKAKIVHLLPKKKIIRKTAIPIFKPAPLAPQAPSVKKKSFALRHLFAKIKIPKIKIPRLKLAVPHFEIKEKLISLKAKIVHLLPKKKIVRKKAIPIFKPLPLAPQAPSVKKKSFALRHLFAKIKIPKIKVPQLKLTVPHFEIKEKFVSLKARIVHLLPKKKLVRKKAIPIFKPLPLASQSLSIKKKSFALRHLFAKIKLPKPRLPRINIHFPSLHLKESFGHLKTKLVHLIPKNKNKILKELPSLKVKKVEEHPVPEKRHLFATLKTRLFQKNKHAVKNKFTLFKESAPVVLKEPLPILQLPKKKERPQPFIPRAEPSMTTLETPAFVDSWKRTQDLLENCQRCIKRQDLDRGEIYYEELKPLFSKLSREEKHQVYPLLVELQNQLVMLRFKKVKQSLKR